MITIEYKMDQQLPSGRFVGYQDLTDDEYEDFVLHVFLEEFELIAICPDTIFLTLEQPWKEYKLLSIEHLMRYTPVRRSMRQICKMYRKVKRSNSIVRCSLKTTEIVLQEIVETFEPWLGFQINTIDGITLLTMKYIKHLLTRPSDQFLPMTRFYKRILLHFLHYRWLIVKDAAVNNINNLFENCLNAPPETS